MFHVMISFDSLAQNNTIVRGFLFEEVELNLLVISGGLDVSVKETTTKENPERSVQWVLPETRDRLYFKSP